MPCIRIQDYDSIVHIFDCSPPHGCFSDLLLNLLWYSNACILTTACYCSLFYRDLLDLTKDNILIKESKVQGIMLSGVTEVSIVLVPHAMLRFDTDLGKSFERAAFPFSILLIVEMDILILRCLYPLTFPCLTSWVATLRSRLNIKP